MGALVLGMHRSGTSALAGALEAMGLSVGPDDDVMPADDGNPEGYYELWSIVRANDDLLAHFGGRWDSPPDLATDWTDDGVTKDFVHTMRAHLVELFDGGRYFLKDPRMSLLVPAWRQVTEDQDCAIVIVRDPVEVGRVAASAKWAAGADRSRVMGRLQPRHVSGPSWRACSRLHVCRPQWNVRSTSSATSPRVCARGARSLMTSISTKALSSIRPEPET